ncbi:hypothetical protein L3X38_001542 [Prunus dulcis]|uniref:Gnk2-homologous domain-containing protein n=1 Tax=Prunus dulcis TaxID=3755 RepID=A0AAD4ZJX9_PRUDU|nr:hypothetical protein L3X38_001542 [Prunus dulcis]
MVRGLPSQIHLFNFFGKIDNKVPNDLASENVDGKHHELVIQKTTEMLTQLEDEASMAPKPYALKTFGLTIDSHKILFWKNYEKELHGKVQCTMDLSKDDCKNSWDYLCWRLWRFCSKGNCSDSGTAVIWFGACHVKYSNNDFSGQIDNKVRCDVAPQNVTNPKSFYKWTKYVLNVLVVNASTPETHYALDTVRVPYGNVHKIMWWRNKKKASSCSSMHWGPFEMSLQEVS